jgi:hypothetical protein
VPLDSRLRGNDDNDWFITRRGRNTSTAPLENWGSLSLLAAFLEKPPGGWLYWGRATFVSKEFASEESYDSGTVEKASGDDRMSLWTKRKS